MIALILLTLALGQSGSPACEKLSNRYDQISREISDANQGIRLDKSDNVGRVAEGSQIILLMQANQCQVPDEPVGDYYTNAARICIRDYLTTPTISPAPTIAKDANGKPSSPPTFGAALPDWPKSCDRSTWKRDP